MLYYLLCDCVGSTSRRLNHYVAGIGTGCKIMSNVPTVPTYILLGDDLFREGLRLLLSRTCFRPYGCAIDLDDLTGVPSGRTTLFIVGTKQANLCSRIRDQYPLALIVAMANESDPLPLATALENGANAALFSSVSPSALVSTLRALKDGKLILIDSRLWSRELQPRTEEPTTPLLQDRASPPLQNDASYDAADEAHGAKQLSSREVAILQRIVQGDSNKHIAKFFGITEPTVKAHVKAILRKLGANNRTQAAIWAINHNVRSEHAAGCSDNPDPRRNGVRRGEPHIA
jgi:two-component system, NarL family, nitrate/nitrite response regulator NarL